MRELHIEVPRGTGEQVAAIARELHAMNVARMEAQGADGAIELILAWLPNRNVEELLSRVSEIAPARFTLAPRGFLPMAAPASEVPERLVDVQPRSPLEIYLSGLQSIGSWTSYLVFSLASGIVVWIGFATNIVYLLVAAMLIAPYAGPAMNAAIGTISGDLRLLGSSVLRYWTGLAVAVATSAIATWTTGMLGPTALMVDVSLIMESAVVLAVVSGAAGAVGLVQSERDSLVSTAAVGMLVAVSLAPPAGLLGAALVFGRLDMIRSGAFLIVLQFLGILLAGALVFWRFGVAASGPRFGREQHRGGVVALVLTAACLIGLVIWQLAGDAGLERLSVVRRAQELAQQAVQQQGMARVLDASFRFTGQRHDERAVLFGQIYAQRMGAKGAPSLTAQDLEARLRSLVSEELDGRWDGVEPQVSVSVMD
jgi:uncharacterized membrane protein